MLVFLLNYNSIKVKPLYNNIDYKEVKNQ